MKNGELQEDNPANKRRIITLFPLFHQMRNKTRNLSTNTILELVALLLFVLFVTAPLFDLSSEKVPQGREFLWAIHANHTWERVKECGTCAYWDGSVQGGMPAFANVFSAFLHPVVMIATYIWGVINGAKISIILAFCMVGFGQWWLGRLLDVGWLARLTMAFISVVSGHFIARLDIGAFTIVMGLASYSLILPAFMAFLRDFRARNMVILSVLLATLGVSGTGYIQVGAAYVLLISSAVFLIINNRLWLRFLKRFAGSVLLALLFAAPLILPFMNLLPVFGKFNDANFTGAQPLGYIPLNLFIQDIGFYTNDVLSKLPYPSHVAMYIGWLPVLFAGFSLRFNSSEAKKWQLWILVSAAFTALWVASATPIKWTIQLSPFDWFDSLLAGVRFTPFIAHMCVPPLLGLGALGLDALFKLKWPVLRFGFSNQEMDNHWVNISTRYILIVVCFYAIQSPYDFNKRWIGLYSMPLYVIQALDANKPTEIEWVAVPWGENFWIEPAVARGYKLSLDYLRTWQWKDHSAPNAEKEFSVESNKPGMSLVNMTANVYYYEILDAAPYASLIHPDGDMLTCHAQGSGGYITVLCDQSEVGVLIVQENHFSGWRAWVNGERVPLRTDTQWLSVDVPPGETTVQFRYQPWDVPLGLALSVMGVGLSVWLWRKDKNYPMDQESNDLPPSLTPGEAEDEVGVQSVQNTEYE